MAQSQPHPAKPTVKVAPGTEGTSFVYFAYGSNLSTARLTEAQRAPTATPMGRGRLPGHVLAFHKLSTRDHSSKANAHWTGEQGDVVEGVLFRIQEVDRACLDFAEGAGKGYEAREGLVQPLAGLPIPSLVYIATTTPSEEPPYDWYVNYVRAGALEHHLPAAYIATFIDSVCREEGCARLRHTEPVPASVRQPA